MAELKRVGYDCSVLYNCCRCGGVECGCAYCFDCKACDSCQDYDGDDINQDCYNIERY